MKDNFILSVCVSAFVLFLLPCNCFNVGKRSFSINRLSMTSTPPSNPPKKGIGFNYDPSDFRDSNSGNYRRLSDRLAAKKAEDEKLEKEREELIRKEQMEKFEKEQMEKRVQELLESDEIIATPEDVVIDPAVEKIFEDLDNELIGLQSVKDSLRRYVALLAMDKIRR